MSFENTSLGTFGGQPGGDTGGDLGLPGGCLRGCLGGCLRGCFGAIQGMIWVDEWDTTNDRGWGGRRPRPPEDLWGAAEGRPPQIIYTNHPPDGPKTAPQTAPQTAAQTVPDLPRTPPGFPPKSFQRGLFKKHIAEKPYVRFSYVPPGSHQTPTRPVQDPTHSKNK